MIIRYYIASKWQAYWHRIPKGNSDLITSNWKRNFVHIFWYPGAPLCMRQKNYTLVFVLAKQHAADKFQTKFGESVYRPINRYCCEHYIQICHTKIRYITSL